MDLFLLLFTILLDYSRLTIADNTGRRFECNSLVHQCRLKFHSIVDSRLHNQLLCNEPMLTTRFTVVTVADTEAQHLHMQLSLQRLNHTQTVSAIAGLYWGSFVKSNFLVA